MKTITEKTFKDCPKCKRPFKKKTKDKKEICKCCEVEKEE